MCGIAGFVHLNGLAKPQVVTCMAQQLYHRGPDDEGYVLLTGNIGNNESDSLIVAGGENTPANVYAGAFPYAPMKKMQDIENLVPLCSLALAARRLAVLDLSPAGHQPLCDDRQMIWIVHNGEIYNYREIRKRLEAFGHRFWSDTDTEVILHAYQEWGPKCLEEFYGMWAFVIWDRQKGELFCARDRFGIKPFYYYFDGQQFAFASEIKALLELPQIERRANDSIIYDYLVRNIHDHNEQTFFQDIYQLRGGECLHLSLNPKAHPKIQKYWDINPLNLLYGLSDEEYAQRFYEIFKDSVQKRLISDVPLGFCLSGGLDSSSIVCLVDQLLRKKQAMLGRGETIPKTFSARYTDPRHDEGAYIKEVCQQALVEPYSIYPEHQNFCEEIERLIYHQDEPFGTLSIYAQWNVFKLARQIGVKVTLDGQGADELLGGYHSTFIPYFAYWLSQCDWKRYSKELNAYADIHHYSRVRATLWSLGFWLWMSLHLSIVHSVLMPLIHSWRYGKRLAWIHPAFSAYMRKHHLTGPTIAQHFNRDLFHNYLYHITICPGLHHLLHYEDRNSMAHSIEARLPFLDHRLVEFVFAIPADQKIRQGWTKYLLRQATKGTLPERVRLRPDKIGFSTPQDQWFRGLLKTWAQDVLFSLNIAQRPYISVKQVRALWDAHQRCEGDFSNDLWRIINLELWFQKFIDK